MPVRLAGFSVALEAIPDESKSAREKKKNKIWFLFAHLKFQMDLSSASSRHLFPEGQLLLIE
ncbi:hypothetical protein BTJ40_06810 [Microbulbifer sp. A4B17]|nr:hypothetical protein BTJ40_06810 [Microbulbifer sp. A4B17]